MNLMDRIFGESNIVTVPRQSTEKKGVTRMKKTTKPTKKRTTRKAKVTKKSSLSTSDQIKARAAARRAAEAAKKAETAKAETAKAESRKGLEARQAAAFVAGLKAFGYVKRGNFFVKGDLRVTRKLEIQTKRSGKWVTRRTHGNIGNCMAHVMNIG